MKLKIFGKKKNTDSKIIDLLDRTLTIAEELRSVNPSQGFQYFRKANKLYSKKDYDFESEKRINNLCFAYMEIYPPTCA